MAKTAKAIEEKTEEGSRKAGSQFAGDGREVSATGGQNQPPQAPVPVGGDSQADSKKQVSAQRVEFPEAAPDQVRGAEAADSPGKLDIILDMNIPITVAIGRTEMPVRRLLQLRPGSVLKLNKPIDAPVDLFLKDSLFAEGDVVVVDERFAVRIKQIIGANRESPIANGESQMANR